MTLAPYDRTWNILAVLLATGIILFAADADEQTRSYRLDIAANSTHLTIVARARAAPVTPADRFASGQPTAISTARGASIDTLVSE